MLSLVFRRSLLTTYPLFDLPSRSFRNKPHKRQDEHGWESLHGERQPPRPLWRPRNEIEPVFEPRRDDGAQKETGLVRASEHPTVARVGHLHDIRRPSGLHENRSEPENEPPTHEGAKVVRSGLRDCTDDADQRAHNHPEATTVPVGAGTRKEAPCDIANDVQCRYEPLISWGYAEERVECIDRGQSAYGGTRSVRT